MFQGLGQDASRAFTGKSPTGKATAETSWRVHFAGRSSRKLEPINFRCKQVILLILILDSGDSHELHTLCVLCARAKMRCAKCCWASCPQGCRFPKEDLCMGDSLWLTNGAVALRCLIRVYAPDNDVDFSTISTTDNFSKWWSALWNFSVIFRKLYFPRTARNFPHSDLAVFTVLLPASSFSSLLFFFTIFQQNHKDNKCSKRMSSNQGAWQRIYKKGATKALCATNKQNHEQ